MRRTTRAGLGLVLLTAACGPQLPDVEWDADVLIVGAGIAGLSAALEIAGGGGDVLVVDMASVFGGHAVSAHGGLAIVGSPEQQAAGVEDSPELAYDDFMNWGEDAEPAWVRSYVDNSRTDVRDWVAELGVQFERLWHLPGNTVPRFHNVIGRGLGLVTPIYLGALSSGVRFRWNTRAEQLIVDRGRVTGVRVVGERTGAADTLRAPAVLLATGGFQSNLERVEAHWNDDVPFPDRILAGSGWNSQGLGLDLAAAAGAQMHRLDHQWNYVTGVPDPRYPGANRGLNVLTDSAISVNVEGIRFVNECASAKDAMPALLAQPTGTYWAMFDARARSSVTVSGSGWTDEKVEQLVFRNPELVKTAPSIPLLARATNIPEAILTSTVARFNDAVARGVDEAFGRFGTVDDGLPCRSPATLTVPPFYAIRMYPLARKSMGGIRIDSLGQVLGEGDGAIPGLFGAGEATGFGGINGRAGLEGTFLGPSVYTGRVAGRSVLTELRRLGQLAGREPAAYARPAALFDPDARFGDETCTGCHDLAQLIEAERPGYWHFELSHRVIVDAGYRCSQCHAELAPFDESAHEADPVNRAGTCSTCHGLQAID